MSQTKLSLASQSLLFADDFASSTALDQPGTYTLTLSVNLGFMAGLADTVVGAAVVRIISVIIATGGFVASLAVIILAPVFPSLVSPAPPQASSPLGSPHASSSPHPRHLRRRDSPATITLSVRREPGISPIIERDSTTRPPPPIRRVSFSPPASSTSVLLDPPSRPGSSNGHATGTRRVLEIDGQPAYILPTPPASIASVSSEGDDTETLGVDEFGNATPSTGKRKPRVFSFARKTKQKGKGKEAVRFDTRDEDSTSAAGLFKNRRRAQSLGYALEASASPAADSPRKRNSLLSYCSREGSIAGSVGDDTVRESEAEAASTEKEARRRSGLSFTEFKAAFTKRERRSLGAYALSPPSDAADLDPTPRTPVPAGVELGIGRPSSGKATLTSPRSSSDDVARAKRALRLDTINLGLEESGRREVQSPMNTPVRSQPHQPLPLRQSQPRPHAPLFGGEVVIRNESGRRRTRSSAIPGLYADAEVVRRW